MAGIGGRGRRAAAVYDPSRRAPAGPSARPICAMCACAPAAALKGAPRVRGRWGRGRGWGQLVGMAASQTAGDAWEEDVRLVVLRYGDVADLWPVTLPVPSSAGASSSSASAAAAPPPPPPPPPPQRWWQQDCTGIRRRGGRSRRQAARRTLPAARASAQQGVRLGSGPARDGTVTGTAGRQEAAARGRAIVLWTRGSDDESEEFGVQASTASVRSLGLR